MDSSVEANCVSCRGPLSEDDLYHYARHSQDICDACAGVIANHFWYWHSGRYLTWDNPDTLAAPSKTQIPEALRWRVFERDDFRCLSCGSRHYLRADHIEPESCGGPTNLDNLQTLCRSCNSKKGTKNTDYRGSTTHGEE